MNSPEIDILLATYNGERYLREQIDSILGQTYPHLKILCWDDRSSDGTAAILDEYASRFPERVRVLSNGTASGHPKRNFLRLMEASTAEYICFSDQDDVWIPEKISLTMQTMLQLEERHGRETPLLVFTDLRVVDEQLQTVHPSFWKRSKLQAKNIHRLHRVLVENVVTGCTAMINRSMCNLALRMPAEAEMHDYWICLLSAAFGAAEELPQPTVLYRQHGTAFTGTKWTEKTFLRRLVAITQTSDLHRSRRERQNQAQALLRIHEHQMTETQKEVVKAFLLSGRSANVWRRLGTTLRYRFLPGGFAGSISTILDLYKSRLID